MPQTHSFGIEPIACHAWNKDRTQLALSLNDHEVKIYSYSGNNWTLAHTLSEHQERVTGIDWAPGSNRIVTCGADRNAYVWQLQADGKWTPTLVILRINRAATCVKWSPQENKFAVGSGARLISVCYFEQENDWWVSKRIKKPIRSTVTCLDWHPNNILLACGSTDFKARVFSGYVKEVESKPEACAWGKKMILGNVMAEFSNGGGGWVHDVSFSASGDKLAWVGHDSSISVVQASPDGNHQLVFSKTIYRPFVTCTWITETSVLVAGHDCIPLVYSYSNGSLKLAGKLDDTNKGQAAQKFSALKHFRALDSRATSQEDTTTLSSTHQNTILQASIFSGTKAGAVKICTTGIDGMLALWDMKSLESSMAGMKI
jgi:actin related protein 2/3 complex subunit 1A/1B